MSDIFKADSFVTNLKNTKLNKKKYDELYKKSGYVRKCNYFYFFWKL